MKDTMLTVHAWRDREPAALGIAGMRLGPVVIGDPVADARGMFDDGARYVRLPRSVELDIEDPDVVRALALVRELTSYGIAVDWKINLGADPGRWPLLSHIYPPRLIISDHSAAGDRESWRKTFHMAKLGYRRGPGFIQVRDYRTGTLKRHTLRIRDDEESFSSLLTGTAGAALSKPLRNFYHREGLITEVCGKMLWLPYRIRAWPLSHFML